MIVNNKGEHARHIGVYLEPGANVLSEKDATKFTKVYEDPRLQHLTNDIEVVKENEEDSSSSAFTSLNAKQAIELVKSTSDLALLEQFRKEETEGDGRKTVLEAIDARVEVLSNPVIEEAPAAEEQE
ncbi:hypothetical protein [Domibacillus iocasae]|uniref:Uncharacterized protein n=1 Tax=Domibacillus iocasae TaxID=1714016 RepID=A0A1E7DQF7_9BACI|nr:hypothetical protein [Domibacillus iocasae]OES45235.1 hypothetical protein BA724_04295 [Domibacillus iocasae]